MNCLCWAQYYRWIWYGFIWEFMVVVVLIQSIFCVAYIMVFSTLACLYFTSLCFTLLYFTLPWSVLSQPNAHYILQWKVFPKSLLSFFFSLCYSLPIQSIHTTESHCKTNVKYLTHTPLLVIDTKNLFWMPCQGCLHFLPHKAHVRPAGLCILSLVLSSYQNIYIHHINIITQYNHFFKYFLFLYFFTKKNFCLNKFHLTNLNWLLQVPFKFMFLAVKRVFKCCVCLRIHWKMFQLFCLLILLSLYFVLLFCTHF